MSKPEDVRLYAILARNSSRAVLFRRGPSKRVLIISWNLTDDTFEDGQWLNGRIYERRCDLSPDGDMLIYFAASYRKPFFSWSAVSRPPFLTALALWPKGDGWGGGGLFETKRNLLLNHRANEMELGPDFRVPRWLKVTPFGTHPGWGEDDPIWATRLERDGWRFIGGGRHKVDRKAKVWVTFNTPIVWEKDHPQLPNRYVLRMSIGGIKEKDGPWYLTEHEVLDRSSGETASLGRSDWADWSASGDLLYAQQGKLYRCECELPLHPRMLQDFSGRTFRELAAPLEALRWPAK